MIKLKRLKEPSTWAGLAVILQAAKVLVPGYALAIDAVAVAAGSMAVVLREGRGGDAVHE